MTLMPASICRQWVAPRLVPWVPDAPGVARPVGVSAGDTVVHAPRRPAAAPAASRRTHYAANTDADVRRRRTLAYALWVGASLAGTAALTALPVALVLASRFAPALLGSPAWTVAGGVVLLLMVGAALAASAALERCTEAPAHLLAGERAQAQAGQAAPAPQPQQIVAKASPEVPSVAAGKIAEGVERRQRDMRGYPPCAAYAPTEAGRPADHTTYSGQIAAPDGMSYNLVGVRAAGWQSHLLVGTLMDGLSILTYDAYSRKGDVPYLAGGYLGGWPGSFLMVGGEAGGFWAPGALGARLNSNVNLSHATDKKITPANDAYGDDASAPNWPEEGGTVATVRALEKDSLPADVGRRGYLVTTTTDYARGGAAVPALSKIVRLSRLGTLLPARAFFRFDYKFYYNEKLQQPAGLADAVRARLERPAASDTPPLWGCTPRRFWSWLKQPPTATHGATPLRLVAGGTFAQDGEVVRGRMPFAHLFGVFGGRYDVGQDHYALKVALHAASAAQPAQYEVTYVERAQQSRRRVLVLAGALSTDAGERSTHECHFVATFAAAADAVGAELQVGALTALSVALRGQDDPAARAAAWTAFRQTLKVPVQRLKLSAEAASVDAGIWGLPACASFMPVKLPTGFGNGLGMGHRATAHVSANAYDAADKLVEVTTVKMGTPHVATAGPFGRRSQSVWAELGHKLGADGKAAQLSLRICSHWQLSRATPLEVLDYVKTPLAASLARTDAENAAALAPELTADGVLAGAGWCRSSVKHWCSSREVDVTRTLDHAELQQLATVSLQAWQAAHWPASAGPATGVLLSEAIGKALPSLQGQPLQPSAPAWLALSQAVARFVDAVGLAAPGILHAQLGALASAAAKTPAPNRALWLATRSNAYAHPGEVLDQLRLDREVQAQHTGASATEKEADDLHRRAAQAIEAAHAAVVLAADDPFLLPDDRSRYQQRLRRVAAALHGFTRPMPAV